MPLDGSVKKWLADTFGQNVTFDEPMRRHTSLRVGGPAEAFVTPDKRDDLIRLVRWACEQDIVYMPLGAGSNLLIKDSGIGGIVISLDRCLKAIVPGDSGPTRAFVSAEAGVKLPLLCAYAADRGLSGLNFAMGIPGTVGGGIKANAGTGHGCLGDIVTSVDVLMPGGATRTIDRKALRFSYRNLAWPADIGGTVAEPIILQGSIGLEHADRHDVRKEADRILKHRKQAQPWRNPSAGCIFKNPEQGRSAGQLIDLAGLKGRRIGDAQVSPTHANFIINRGRATAGDILALMELIRETVIEHHHVQLEPEVKIVGK